MELKVLQGPRISQVRPLLLTFLALFALQGLGTSKDSDARDYFSHMAKHMIPFGSTQDGDRELIDLAFSKKKADDRKEWLRHFRVRASSRDLSRCPSVNSPIDFCSPVPISTITRTRFRIPISSTRS